MNELFRHSQQELAEIFARFIGRALTLELTPCSGQELALIRAQPGVGVTIRGQGREIILLIPEGALLPADYRSPSPTSQSRLSTLAQELAVALFPEDLEAAGTWEVALPQKGPETAQGAAQEAEVLRLRLSDQAGNLVGTAVALIYEGPRPHPTQGTQEFATNPTAPRSAGSAPPPEISGQEKTSRPSVATLGQKEEPRAEANLPPLVRALLRVPVCVGVTLARRRQPVANLLQLSPGAIIQFDKSCEELLDLEVAGRVIAQGEAVKVGEKFGLRILKIMPPPERTQTLRPNKSG
ncbi:MAG: FliM/FliN family flagellar motor switch protein [Thermoguttaceae bacterium]|nr:FliM/FliN family flagellar motor switch protein [Thermoguttaceae bacterium]MDW8078496.1 FliM/FliN family flagellar motor switch protein [Thermoguttaceae bacterium]